MSEAKAAAASSLLSRRRLLAGASLTVGALIGGLTASVACASDSAAGSEKPRGTGEARVVVRPDAVEAPEELAPGPVTFHAATPADSSMSVLLIRLKAPLRKYLADLKAMGAAQSPEDKAAAAAKVEADADNLGGAVLLPGEQTVSFTQVLLPGRYYLIGYAYDTPGAEPVAHRLTVEGVPGAAAPRVDGLVLQTPSGFTVPGGTLSADGDLLVVNRSGALNEAVLIPVRPGTTTEDVDAFFAALAEGQQPPSAPFVGKSSGLAPLSPGRFARLRTGLEPGEYLLSSWVTSTDTGRPRAFDGFYRLVRLT